MYPKAACLLILLTMPAVLLAAPQQEAPEQNIEDLELLMTFDWDRLQGTWLVDTAIRDGNEIEAFAGVEYYIEPRLMRWVAPNRIHEVTGMPVTLGRFLTPRSADEVQADPTFPGSASNIFKFEVDGDTLVMTSSGLTPESPVTTIKLTRKNRDLPRPKPDEMIGLAQAAYTNKEWTRAYAFSQLQLIHYPNDKAAELLLAESRLRKALELSVMDTVAEDIQRTTFEASWALSKHTDETRLRRLFAEFLMKYLRLEDAVKQWELLAEEDALDNEGKFMLARCHVGLRNLPAAKRILAEIIGYNIYTEKLNEDANLMATDSINLLAAMLSEDGQIEKGEAILNAVIEEMPNKAQPYLMRGRFYAFRKLRDKAAADVTKAMELEPNNLEAMVANIEVGLNRKDPQVGALIARALETHDRPPRLLVYAATLAGSQGQFERAIQLAKEALAQSPKDLTLNLMLTEFHAANKDFPAAYQSLAEMKERGVPETMLKLSEAKILTREKKFKDAAKIVRALAKVNLPPALRQQLQIIAQQIRDGAAKAQGRAQSTQAAQQP